MLEIYQLTVKPRKPKHVIFNCLLKMIVKAISKTCYIKIHMIDGFLSFPDLFNDQIFINKKLNKVIKSYQFIYAHENLEFNKNPTIYQNFKDSKIAIINRIKEANPDFENQFFIDKINGVSFLEL